MAQESTHVSERSTHNDGSVPVLFIVVEDLLDANDAGVFVALVVGAGVLGLIPIEDTADEGADQGDTRFGTSHSLAETEEQGKVAVNLVVALKFPSSLNAFPCRSNFDEDTLLGNTLIGVKGDELLGLRICPTMSMAKVGLLCGNDIRTFALVASLSKERRASTSVETRPGMILRMAVPKFTSLGEKTRM